MLAHRRPPGGRSDAVWFKGVGTENPMADIPVPYQKKYRQLAERAGVSIHGKRYLSRLADYPGDPEAWVDSQGDVRRVVEKRGLSCEGMGLNIPGVERPEKEWGPPKVNDKIVDRVVNEHLADAGNPVLKPHERMDLYEKVRADLTPDIAPG